MNAVSFAVLVAVVLVTAGAAYRTYRMIRNNDLCYACPEAGRCSHCNPINCSIKEE